MGSVAPSPDTQETTRRGRRLYPTPGDIAVLALAAAIVALDQVTKAIIEARIDPGEVWPSASWPVRIIHITNSGAAFGMLQDTGPLLVIASAIGVAIILAYLFTPGFIDPVVRVGLALMLGGATGNLIDRFAAGEVVDFIKFPEFPAFNVADSAITIGVIALLWGILRGTDEPSPSRRATSESSSPGEADGSTR